MYVTNVDQLSISSKRIYRCGAAIAHWLVFENRIPMLGKDGDGKFCFMRTEQLESALDHLPVWYAMREMVFGSK